MQVALTHAKKVISLIAAKSDRAILFYSTGKDSIALLDLVAPHFRQVVLVYMYLVPGLRHVDKYLNYARTKYPNLVIEQVPHWNLSYIHAAGLFCEPKADVRKIKLKDVNQLIRDKYGIDYTFFGMKKADGMTRNVMLRGYELHAVAPTGNVYPLSLWTKKDVLHYIRFQGLPLPIEYTTRKSSQGLGFNADCFNYLARHYPDDLQKILAAYPLAQKVLIDQQNRITHERDEVPKV